MIIEEVDAGDDDAFHEWFGPFHASEQFTWPEEPGWAEHELRVRYRDRSTSDTVIAVARDEAGRAIGSLEVSLPRRESLHVAYILVAVDPAHRRRGVGRVLLEHGEGIARRHGRTKVIGVGDEPVQETKPVSTYFAEATGYKAARSDARRELRLPMAEGRLEALEAACRPFSTGYEIVTWTGSCPDELAERRVDLSRIISADAPRGELDYDAEDWDLPRLRNWERNVEEMDRHLIAAGAVESASGALVAFTEFGLPRRLPEVAYQFDTVVAPGHRGHRLGTLVKIANLRALVERSPATERVLTWNAVDNKPMNRVNEAMGFALIGIGTSWQKDLTS